MKQYKVKLTETVNGKQWFKVTWYDNRKSHSHYYPVKRPHVGLKFVSKLQEQMYQPNDDDTLQTLESLQKEDGHNVE